MSYTATEQANIEAIRQMFAAEAVRDWDTVYSLVTDDCVTYVGDLVLRGQAEMKRYDAQLFPLFASNARAILDITADGEALACRWRADATLAADGRQISWEGVSWCRMEGGKVAEGRIYVDSAAVQRQMSPQKEERSYPATVRRLQTGGIALLPGLEDLERVGLDHRVRQ